MYGRFVRLRRYSHPTKESFVAQGKSRTTSVAERLRPKARIYREESRPSFIADELFARFEAGTFFPRFRFFKTKISRLEWFENYSGKLYDSAAAFNIRDILNEKSSSFTKELSSEIREQIWSTDQSMSAAQEMAVIYQIAKKDIISARIVSNHYSAMEVLANFGCRIIPDHKSLLGIAMTEKFAGVDPQQFDTIIEDFGDDIVLNGKKINVIGAADCDYFLISVATFVKDRDEKLYKRSSTVIVDSKADGVDIDGSTVSFDNVELGDENIVGRVGFGSHHQRHLRDSGNVFYGVITSSKLESHLSKFIEDSQERTRHGLLWRDHDAARAVAADLQTEFWSIDAMIRQISRKRYYLFDELQAEVAAVKVKVDDARRLLERVLQFYQEPSPVELHDDIQQLHEMSATFGNQREALAIVGFAGLSRFYVRNQKILKKRERSSWNIGQYMDNPDFWYKRTQKRWMMIRRPKVVVFGKDSQFCFGTHFFQHDSYIHNPSRQWDVYYRGMADHFDYLFNHNAKLISALTLVLVELHGKDINEDVYKAAQIGRVGVDHFALAALHNRVCYEGRLEELADLLVRNVLKLEGEQFDAMDEKFQWDHALESGFFIESRGVHKKLQDTRSYFIADSLMIEPGYSEPPQYLSAVEKLKLLDSA